MSRFGVNMVKTDARDRKSAKNHLETPRGTHRHAPHTRQPEIHLPTTWSTTLQQTFQRNLYWKPFAGPKIEVAKM